MAHHWFPYPLFAFLLKQEAGWLLSQGGEVRSHALAPVSLPLLGGLARKKQEEAVC
jgi:hypothetical protein